jgi:hypothetical protein
MRDGIVGFENYPMDFCYAQAALSATLLHKQRAAIDAGGVSRRLSFNFPHESRGTR